jgi:Gpi18-like mannosyltransferase
MSKTPDSKSPAAWLNDPAFDKSMITARIEIGLLFVLYLCVLPRVYMDYDMGFWKQWALYIHHSGLANTYSAGSPINYFPVYVYGLYIYDLLQGTDANIIHYINNIKILFLCFDFLPIVVLCCFRQKILSFNIPYLFLLLNIAYVFNSMIWGQIDSIYTNLAFLAIITGIFYPATAVLLYLLALNTKPQAIEFLPVMGIVLLYSVRKYKTILLAITGAVILQVLLLLPFINNGGAGKLITFAYNTVGLYHNLSICAFNIWYLITRDNPYFINDTDTYFLLSYRIIGITLFVVSGSLVMIPMLKKIWQMRKNNLPFNETAYQLLFLSTGLLSLYFFYFNSQMHERYANPIIIFFFFYGVASKNYKLYILASIPYLLSLDKCFSYPDGYLPIVHYKIIYASKIIALWYTATVIYGSWLLYRLLNRPETTI